MPPFDSKAIMEIFIYYYSPNYQIYQELIKGYYKGARDIKGPCDKGLRQRMAHCIKGLAAKVGLWH